MISLILPAYNEAKILRKNTEKVVSFLKNIEEYDFEVIIAEDGSKDGTDKIAHDLSREYPEVRYIHSKKRLGRGKAIKEAFKISKGDTLCYMDVDLPVDPKYLTELIDSAERYEVVIGSRYLEDSFVERPFSRELISRIYNKMVNFLIGIEIHDIQCGFKAFSGDFVENEIFDIEEKSWAWDTIVVVNAIKNNYSLKELPVEWIEKRELSNLELAKRAIEDIFLHSKILLKLFLKWRMGIEIGL